jgi:hypothetical protein
MTDIKEDLNKITMSWSLKELNIVKILVFSKLTHRFNAILTKFPTGVCMYVHMENFLSWYQIYVKCGGSKNLKKSKYEDLLYQIIKQYKRLEKVLRPMEQNITPKWLQM